MKISSITICNFRQFVGSQKLSFSVDEHENISVVHGENGAGKTSILNAFKWCFYGRTDFDTGEKNILNEHAISTSDDGDVISLRIIVEFEHDGRNYIADRFQEYKKLVNNGVEPVGGNVFELSWIAAGGGFEKSKNPGTQINQILPEGMHSYFFFNGERIEKLAYASASHEIRDAIRNLMGLEIMERGRAHLSGHVRKHFNKQMSEGASGLLKDLIEKEGLLDEKIEKIKNDITSEDDNIAGFEETIQVVEKRLLSIKDVAALQEERNRLNESLSSNREAFEETTRKIKHVIGTRGFLAFLHDAAPHVSGILEERRQKGELPYAIKRQFIDDLLDKGNCICGTDLVKGEEPYQNVHRYRDKASPEGIEEAFTRTFGALGQFGWARNDMYQSLLGLLADRKSLDDTREELEGALSEISSKVSDSELEDVTQLEARRRQCEIDRDSAVGHRGLLRGRLEEARAELEQVQKERKEQEEKSGKVALASKRHTVVEEAARVLEELHDALAEQTKQKLSKRVNETFQNILKKDYRAEIDDDYCLRVIKDVPGVGPQIVHEKSTGESQVTSLSFVASIVSLAHEQSLKDSTFFKGGVFPIIMDSPFGALDPDYRTLIARHIPELAQQIILLVSKSQWDGEVQEECEKRVGKHQSLIYFAPKVREGLDSYYARPGSEYEYTKVEEGYHG